MLPCQSLSSIQIQTGDLSRILMTTARTRRLGRNELHSKRRISRRLSHQLSVDNDILVAGQDLHDKVKLDKSLIRSCNYLTKSYPSSFKGEDLLHWMISHSWASNAVEAMSISQLLLTHNVIVNVSDNRHLMSFKKYAIYRFREDQDAVGLEPNQSDGMDNCLDMLYKRMWSEWVIRSRVIGWWLYTNTLTGQEFIGWLVTSEITSSREEAHHFANQLFLVNFLIRVYPIPSTATGDTSAEFTDDDTIYQINVCCNQSVDLTTKVVHRLAHAVRLCSTASEECMFYGKSDVQEDVILEQFEMEETDPPRESGDTDTSLEDEEQAKKFLQSVCRAYYPSFTSAIEDTYYSYEVDPGGPPESPKSIPDDLFHSFELSTYDEEDSIVVELEDGVDLQDFPSRDSLPEREDILEQLGNRRRSSARRVRSSTLDLIPTPVDRSFLFETSRLEIQFEDLQISDSNY